MSAGLFLVLDAGTSAARVIVYTTDGRRLAEAACPWSYTTPAEAAPWGRAFDPQAFWAQLAGAIRQVMYKVGSNTTPILAISVTSQRQGIVLLDADGVELYAGPNIDLRGVMEGARLLNENGAEIYRITGHLPPMLFAPARLLWFRDQQPALYRRFARLLTLDGWLTWRLCGEMVAEPSAAAETGLLDVTRRTWSQELIELWGFLPELLPPLASAGTAVGHVTQQAAAETGLPAGTLVVVAGADSQCGLLGLGGVRPGQVGIIAGWSAPVQRIVAAPIFDPARSLWATCHLIPELWLVEGNAGPAGLAHRWLRDLLLPGESWAAFDALAASAPPSAFGPLAFLGPRVADYGNPRLLWGGLLFPQALDLWPVERAHLARAVLENIAFALRANLDRIAALVRSQPDAITAGGGLIQSRLFAQILADVLGRPIQLSPDPTVSGLGAAICAAVGCGQYPDLEQAVAAMTRRPASDVPDASDAGIGGERSIVEPGRMAHAEYLDAYERWVSVYRSLEELSEESE